MEADADSTQKSHGRFNECFRNVLSFLIFSGFLNIIGLTTAIIITINSFRYKVETQITVASFLIILCTVLAGTATYFIYVQSRRIQKIYEAQLISLVQLETNNCIRRGASSQTIVFLDSAMLATPTSQVVSPPSYASIVASTEQTPND